ncbi:hypothetical protein [Spongiactinospora sp. TRM90649]|uniref:hypothetical protein n=1 Tax=Spongiactinospora sp. TRM90649 TaxID=3031114 RepID=UPI0023F70986|nr:hypothetical protein [Spongiactinospora sp. TRM90649]MDF5756586.1 hypothetical protein [Spongiactinospora sp. TRM90649]
MADDIPVAALARLLVRAREARLDALSVNEAARRAARISGGRFSRNTWDAAEKGDQVVLSKPPRVATMALVLSDEGALDNITPDHLDAAGAHEAAALFRARLTSGHEAAAPEMENLPAGLRTWLEAAIEEIRALPVTQREHEAMAAALTAQAVAMYEMHATQVRIMRKN